MVDSVIERVPIRIQTEAQNAEAAQRVAPVLLPKFRHLLSRRQANLDRADELGRVVGMNLLRGGAIEAVENAMQVIRSAAVSKLSQSLTQFFRTLRTGEKSFKQGAKIEAGSADDDRQVAARF